MAQVVPASTPLSTPDKLSLTAQLELAAAARSAERVAARTRTPRMTLELVDRRSALRARSMFRAATAILQAEMVSR